MDWFNCRFIIYKTLAILTFTSLATGSLLSQYEKLKFMEVTEENEEHLKLMASYLNSSMLDTYAGENCLRPCTLHEPPRICYYRWTLEYYQTMGTACKDCQAGVHSDCFGHQCVTTDGVERGFMAINRQFPGPLLEICQGDHLVVDVDNGMPGTSTSIHWHGILQKNTHFWDGVAMVSQCPISYFTKFRYQIESTVPGTQHYHSHAGELCGFRRFDIKLKIENDANFLVKVITSRMELLVL